MLNLDAIVVVDKTHVGKRRFVFPREHEALANDIIDSFGNVLIRASKREVVDLAEEENFDATERSGVNRTIVCGAFKVEFRREENQIDVALP